ncbi:hypothetical protein AB0O91_36830 [Kitasatospora sp. NPDC089797]|uniref:hypothetical protein n=1 Tax=Kitasatospora sp. NPDC089797 TaxID=3155298 RepID=UPI003415A263
MNTDQIIAAVSAGGGALAAGFAGWQASIARGQANEARAAEAAAEAAAEVARRQAIAAEDQAAAARDRVRAAEEQVELLRRQLDADDAERREARGPEFGVRYWGPSMAAPPELRVKRFEITQTAGPALSAITVSAAGANVLGIFTGRGIDPAHVQTGPISTGGTFLVDVAVNPEVTRRIPVLLSFECSAEDNTYGWRRSQTSHVEPPPRISSPARRSFR